MSAPPVLDKSALIAVRDSLRAVQTAATVHNDAKTPQKSAVIERVVTRVKTPEYSRVTIKNMSKIEPRGVDIVEYTNKPASPQNDTRNAFYDLFNRAGAIEEARLSRHIRGLLRGEYITAGSLCIARYEGEGVGAVYRLYRNGVEITTEAYTHNIKGRVTRMARTALARGWVVDKTVKVYGRADCECLELSRDELIRSGAITAELSDISVIAG